MKTFLHFATYMMLLASIITSCKNKADEVVPSVSNAVYSNARKDAEAVMTLNFNPAIAIIGESASVSATIYPTPESGVIKIQRAKDASGQYTTADLAADWETIFTGDARLGVISTTFLPTIVGDFGFRAHFVPKGGAGMGASFVKANVKVVEACKGLKLLKPEITKVIYLGQDNYQFTVTYKVKACGNFNSLKLQGGLTAISKINELSAGATVKLTRLNHVISWEIGNMKDAEKEFTVTFTKKLTGAGTHELTGDWSVKGFDAAGYTVMAGYDNKVTYTIQ
jgi:hypothetical protein